MNESKINIQLGGFSTLLTIAFIILKLTGIIDWSWVWVLSPIWIPMAIACLFLIGAYLIVWK